MNKRFLRGIFILASTLTSVAANAVDPAKQLAALNVALVQSVKSDQCKCHYQFSCQYGRLKNNRIE